MPHIWAWCIYFNVKLEEVDNWAVKQQRLQPCLMNCLYWLCITTLAMVAYLKIIMRKHLENIKHMTHWSVPMRKGIPMHCQCLGNRACERCESRLQYWPNFYSTRKVRFVHLCQHACGWNACVTNGSCLGYYFSSHFGTEARWQLAGMSWDSCNRWSGNVWHFSQGT